MQKKKKSTTLQTECQTPQDTASLIASCTWMGMFSAGNSSHGLNHTSLFYTFHAPCHRTSSARHLDQFSVSTRHTHKVKNHSKTAYGRVTIIQISIPTSALLYDLRPNSKGTKLSDFPWHMSVGSPPRFPTTLPPQ